MRMKGILLGGLISGILWVAIIAVVAWIMSAAAADAHSWYTDRRDPVYGTTTCCGGQDCAPLPEGAVHITKDGLRVTLTLMQAMTINPTRIEPFDELIPFERVQTSEDGRPHICLMRMKIDDRQGFFCIFMPPNG